MKRIMLGVLLVVVGQAQAGSANSVAFVSVPTLDDVGLIGITIVVAIAGALAARRRRK